MKYLFNRSDLTMTTSASRRHFIKILLALGLSEPLSFSLLEAATKDVLVKKIPSSGELLPVIGLGTSRTFDALEDKKLQLQLQQVLQVFFDHQGTLIDSSPMYGSAEQVTGLLLNQLSGSPKLFAATKVWTDGQQAGIKQMENSRKLWGIKKFDLMQIHNLRDWKVHYKTLTAMKAEGKIRYIGVTTSHGRFHSELVNLLKDKPFDFVQLSYNMLAREAENRLLPVAEDRGIAVITNRPFQRGDLFSNVKGKPLPDWATDIEVNSWAQYFLKYIVSHPAVTCTIPATSKARHMLDNMAAQFGHLPDKKQRAEMLSYLNSLG